MARDLHDTIGQELALAVMRVEQIAKDLDAPEADFRKELADCSEWLRKIESETGTRPASATNAHREFAPKLAESRNA